jgi:hypothetical protein
MAIATAQQRENLAIAYGAAATHAGLQTTTAAGTQGTEVSGTFLDSVAVSYAAQGSPGTLTVNFTFTES